MKVLKEPNQLSAGVAVDKKNVYHNFGGKWILCGDCKVSHNHIVKLLEESK